VPDRCTYPAPLTVPSSRQQTGRDRWARVPSHRSVTQWRGFPADSEWNAPENRPLSSLQDLVSAIGYWSYGDNSDRSNTTPRTRPKRPPIPWNQIQAINGIMPPNRPKFRRQPR